MFAVGFLLGRMSTKQSCGSGGKINDNVKYSVRWWIEQAKAQNVTKQKVVSHFHPLVCTGFLEKEKTEQGLTIFVPTSKQAKQRVLEVIQILNDAE